MPSTPHRHCERSTGLSYHQFILSTEGLLSRASGEALSKEARSTIEMISKTCKPCQTHAAARGGSRSRSARKGSALTIAHMLTICSCLLGKPVLHIVDMATLFVSRVTYGHIGQPRFGKVYRPYGIGICRPAGRAESWRRQFIHGGRMREKLQEDGVTLRDE